RSRRRHRSRRARPSSCASPRSQCNPVRCGRRGSVIDLHSHILPGVDDGPATLEESLELARRAAADGVRVIAATPHVRDDYPTQPATMERLVAELRAAIQREGIPIDVRPGAEIAIDWLERLSDDDLGRFGLGGSPHYLLPDFPYGGWP